MHIRLLNMGTPEIFFIARVFSSLLAQMHKMSSKSTSNDVIGSRWSVCQPYTHYPTLNTTEIQYLYILFKNCTNIMKKQKETGTFTGHSRNLILLSLEKLFAITRIQTPVVKASVLGRLSTLFLLLSFDQNKLLFEYGVPSWSRFFSPLKMGQPLPLLLFFWSFQTNIITIFSTNICDKCPSSIQC